MGLPALVAISYAGTFVLLTPLSLVGHMLRLPIEVMSVGIAAAIAWALAVTIRERLWSGLGRVALGALCFELAIVLGDAWLGYRMGGMMGADADFHLARIRHLFDHGFSSDDPFLIEPRLTRNYAFNLYHALLAGMGRLLDVDILVVWRNTLPWAKIVVSCGVYTLGVALSHRKWVGWGAAMAVLGSVGPLEFLLYPNKICPGWLMPLAFAFAYAAVERRPGAILALGATTLLLAQVHPLYGLFAALVLGPTFSVRALLRWTTKRGGLRRELSCLAMLALAAPIPLYGQLADRQEDPLAAQVAQDEPAPPQTARPKPAPRKELAPISPRTLTLLGVLAVSIAAGYRRRETRLPSQFAASVLLTLELAMRSPPARAAVTAVFGGREWVVDRLGMPEQILAYATLLVGPLVGTRADRWLTRRPIHAVVGGCMLMLGVWVRGPQKYRTWGRMLNAGMNVRPLQTRLDWRQQMAHHLVPHTTVLSDASTMRKAGALYDIHAVAAHRVHTGLASLRRRQRDLEKLLDPTLDPQTRASLRARYGIRQAMLRSQSVGLDHWVRQDAVALEGDGGLLYVTFPAQGSDRGREEARGAR